jgi:hypothetical protein
MKFVGVQCDICLVIGPGIKAGWMDLSVDKNTEIMQEAVKKGWTFEGQFDKCPKCSGLLKRKPVKSKVSLEGKELAKKVNKLKGR